MRPEEIWNRSLQLIKQQVGESIFELWFDPIRLVRMESGVAMLEVPNRFFRDWIEDYHPDLIADALEKSASKRYEVKLNVAAKDNKKSGKEDHAASAMAPAEHERKAKGPHKKSIQLSPKYTFNNFVTGPSNQFASAAARAVAEGPGKVYNPLYVYGGAGLGKTHLMTAIGNTMLERATDMNILYVTAEQFTSEVVTAFRHGRADELKNKFRNLDVLLMDDVHIIENKPQTQEEFFHTFNALYDRQRQIVLSSDRPPKEMKNVTDRLRSRFSMGLIADIQPPELETKLAIIQKKADTAGIRMPEDVAYFIASKVKGNVRDIEGCIIKMGAHSSFTGTPISVGMARNILKDNILEDDKPLNVESVAKTVAEYYGLKLQDIKAKKRTRDIAVPRQIAMYLSRELTDYSLNDIGKHLGGKDHATVIYACRQIEARRQKDEDFNRMVLNLLNKLKP